MRIPAFRETFAKTRLVASKVTPSDAAPPPTNARALVALAMIASAALAGCGGDAMAAKGPAEMAPSGTSAPAVAPVDPEGDVDRALADVDRALRSGGAGTPDRLPGTHPNEPAPMGGIDPCTTACQALGSLQSASARLCEIAGDADARCTGARSKLDDAKTRVKNACPTCGVQ